MFILWICDELMPLVSPMATLLVDFGEHWGLLIRLEALLSYDNWCFDFRILYGVMFPLWDPFSTLFIRGSLYYLMADCSLSRGLKEGLLSGVLLSLESSETLKLLLDTSLLR